MRRHLLLAASLWLTLPALASAQGAPPAGAWFRYAYEQRMSEQGGAYAGYSEQTLSHARYEVTEVGDFDAAIRARYAWTYASDERRDTGVEDRTVRFGLLDRRYKTDRTDVSDHDADDPRALATWVWIPPTVSVGESLRILDHDFRVTDLNATIEAAGQMRPAIAVSASYRARRDDDYGSLDTEITDHYWYDRATGMFLREEHDEVARGTLEGQPASFRLRTVISLVDASYARALGAPPEPDYTLPPPVAGYEAAYGEADDDGLGEMFCVFVILVFMGIFALVLIIAFNRKQRRGGVRETANGERFELRAVTGGGDLGKNALSPAFDPFLPHMIETTLKAGQKVVAAHGASGAILGLGLGDREGQCGSIFAPDSDVCEALRRELDHSEFFSDRRHPKLASVAKLGLSAPEHAYNVYETFDVLELDGRPAELGYDGELIAQLTPADRAEVLALLEKVYGVKGERWLDAALAVGDLAWVARDARGLAGFAMASLVGDKARLHSLTVHPDRRTEGFGTALYRARLRALFDLDATSVLTECATWNVAALELARAHGFRKIDTMYVESSRHQRDERRFMRR